ILAPAYYSISNPVVYSLALQVDGKIIIGGKFTNINGTARSNIARLKSDGSGDTSFDARSAASYSVYDVLLHPERKVLMTEDEFRRIHPDGSKDTSFNPVTGYPDHIALQPDGRIFVVSDYTRSNDLPRNRLTRLNTDGSLDATFKSGLGPDS